MGSTTTAGPRNREPVAAGNPEAHAGPPSRDDPRMDTWVAFLYAQSAVMPRLDAQLRNEVGLTLAEFDALFQLSLAGDRRLRMSELADRVLLSRSGVTRLVDRLERDGHVRRESCGPDGRGFFAAVTDKGMGRLRVAMAAHFAAVDAHFLQNVEARDAESLIRALGAVAQANGRPLPSHEESVAALARLTDR